MLNLSINFFLKMALPTDLLRAPTRKRKPESMLGRQGRRGVVKLTWINPKIPTDILDDEIGVYELQDSDCDDYLGQHSAAPVQLLPSGAPRMSVLPIQTKHIPVHGTQLSTVFPDHMQLENWTELLASSDNHVNPSPDWDGLSDEMILQVFTWLPKTILSRCLRVCKRWHRIGLDDTLWRRLDLANKKLKPGVVGTVLNRGASVLRLTRSDIKTPLYTDNTSLNIHRFSKLQYLDVSMAAISEDGLEQLLSPCHLLKKLSLENCSLTDKACRYIGQNHDLEILNLSMCQGITENGLVPICNNLTRLDELNCAWTGMSRGAVVYAVISLPPSLTKLNLSGCRNTLLDEDIQQLCSSCGNIKELDLSDTHSITSVAVLHITSLLQQLEYLALSRCYNVVPSSLPLLSNLPCFLALDVFGMLQDDALFHLQEAMLNIEINNYKFSSIARPTTGIRRTSIWGLRVRDSVV